MTDAPPVDGFVDIMPGFRVANVGANRNGDHVYQVQVRHGPRDWQAHHGGTTRYTDAVALAIRLATRPSLSRPESAPPPPPVATSQHSGSLLEQGLVTAHEAALRGGPKNLSGRCRRARADLCMPTYAADFAERGGWR